MLTVGQVDHSHNGFDPTHLLTDWDQGRVSMLPDGRRLREFDIVAEDKEVEIASSQPGPSMVAVQVRPSGSPRATKSESAKTYPIGSSRGTTTTPRSRS